MAELTSAVLSSDKSKKGHIDEDTNEDHASQAPPGELRIISFNILVGSPISSIIGQPPLMAPPVLPISMLTSLCQVFGCHLKHPRFYYRQRRRMKLQLTQLSDSPKADVIALQEVPSLLPHWNSVFLSLLSML
jgi:hypothetical protein